MVKPFQYYFEWDRLKAKRNLRKHGIAFERAAMIFQDPNALRNLTSIIVIGKNVELQWEWTVPELCSSPVIRLMIQPAMLQPYD